MKHLILIISLVFISFQIDASEIKLGYFPSYKGNVSKENYNYGRSILKNAYAQIESEEDICYADYWNVAIAYTYMGVDKNTVLSLMVRAKEENQESFCYILTKGIEHKEGKENMLLYKLLGEGFDMLASGCTLKTEQTATVASLTEKKNNMNLNGLDVELIDKLIVLMEKDQRYRYSTQVYKDNLDKQRRLDQENAVAIAKIIDKYGYPGKDLVGNEFKDYTCMIVEHAGAPNKEESLQFKEKYFSTILEAYHKDQLSFGVVMMLVDRINWFKYGKQVYGSHAGVPFHDDTTIKKIKSQYNLD